MNRMVEQAFSSPGCELPSRDVIYLQTFLVLDDL